MVWKSWGGSLVSVLLMASSSLLCSGAVIFSEAPRRVSGSSSAFFAFRVAQSGGMSCLGCALTCKVTTRLLVNKNNASQIMLLLRAVQLDDGRASECGSSRNGNGTGTVSYTGLKDGSHAFAVCVVTAAACATYAWDVDTVPPTASVTAGSAFTSASNVSVLISFSEPCPGAGGFTCNNTYCNVILLLEVGITGPLGSVDSSVTTNKETALHCMQLIAYGPGRVEPSTLEVLQPGLRYSVLVTVSPDEQYGRLILVMDRAFCTDAAGHLFTRTSNSSFTLRFDKRNDSMNITTSIPEKLLRIQGVTRLVQATNDANELRIYLSFAQPVLNSSEEILSVLKATDAVLTPTSRSTHGNRRFGYVVNKVSDTAIVTVSCDTSSIISRQGTPVDSASEPFTFLYAFMKLVRAYTLCRYRQLTSWFRFRFCSRVVIVNRDTHYGSICGNCCCRDATHCVNSITCGVWSNLKALFPHDLRAITKSCELVDRSAVGSADDISYPRAQQSQPAAMATEIPGDDDGGKKPIMMPTEIHGGGGKNPVMPMQTIPLDGKPLSAMEYRSFFEQNPDMKPEAEIIMKKLQDLDVWKQFGRNMLWLGVMGGGLILAHAVTLAYLKLRYRGGRAEQGYGALVFPRLEMMVVILAMPCISQAAATMISRGGGVAAVGIVLWGILACLVVGLVLFLCLGIIIGMVQVQYEEEESTRRRRRRYHQWCQEVILGPASRRGHWSCTGSLVLSNKNKLGPLFEDLRGPPPNNNKERMEKMDKLLGVVRIHYTLLEWLKRIIVAAIIATGTASSWVPLSMASLQLLFLLVTKPFIKKRVQLVEMVSLASEVFVFACCQLMMIHGGSGLAMLAVFMLGFAAQMCNQWNALFRQMRLLGGAKTAFAGLLLLFLPSSSSLLLSLLATPTPTPTPTPTDRRRHGFDGEERQQVHRQNNNERSWLRQLREMAKASFTND
ncbi:hypothetical protein PR202_ga06157 [Eleusine coracana subsp. coracana]|uniref:Transmembrane protein n=1 Tax=Eleusine coracana subsp. coracana TaxID=191504 RepID=A0AAV5BWH5_ELECO|nr:hypothetical protein PR202_ga06157 [Eleusine coracana subsp. coracana]